MPVFTQFAFGEGDEIQFPNEAVAVTYNVTVVQTEGIGFVQIDGFFLADGDTSTVNWNAADQQVANSGVSLLTSAFDEFGGLGIHLGGDAAAKAHVILDITGYYLPVP